jgi:hypothetical protein
MNWKKLNKLKREHRDRRRSPQKARDLESLAMRLGRKMTEGRHPTWVSTKFQLRPLSIPHHCGRDIPPGTKNAILDQLEEDLIALEEKLGNEDEAEPREDRDNNGRC